ncbi:MAG TPA: PepSY-associated TM helix domain-containing protein [Gemmatimonadaceae bacterium]|nr:PepSY-associated TM helix domain-containing protein [Gemmatimonadaceae bacterium]
MRSSTLPKRRVAVARKGLMATLFRRSRFARFHRWMAIGLSPVIALILLSGLFLSARPSMEPKRVNRAAPVDVPALQALVAKVDKSGEARNLFVNQAHTTFELARQDHSRIGVYDIHTGMPVPSQPDYESDRDAFDVAQGIHDNLGLGLGWLTSLGSFAIVLIAAIGPFLSRKAGRGTILGTHVKTGWVLMPLALYLPATLVMMRMELPRRMDRSSPPLPVATVLQQASSQADLSDLIIVQSFPGWSFLMVNKAPGRLRLQNGTVTPLKNRVTRLGRTLHTGAWGGIWGGVINAVSACVLLWMLTTGVISTLRRRSLKTAR